MTEIAKGDGWELRLGRYQDVLGDVKASSVICDPPYSERTHSGHREGCFDAHGACNRREIPYLAWSESEMDELCAFQANGWRVILTDHVGARTMERGLKACELYVFAPLPFVHIGGRVRLTGDGPSSWTCWIVVARPKSDVFRKWGTLPGAYIEKGKVDASPLPGGKSLWLMRALVRDYSRPGDLIVDPCAGSGTTLLAAAIEGRRAIGAEMDPATFELAVKRLRKGYTPAMDFGGDE